MTGADLVLTIAVLTFRRPTELASCLQLVTAHAAASSEAFADRRLVVTVLVVDNDPEASARDVVETAAASSPVDITYVVESQPGIAAARSRAVLESAASDVLVFIDDDERPTASWLVPLLTTWLQTGAAGVMGRVVSVFDSPLSPWVAAGEFFRRRRMSSGTPIAVGAAGNLLLDLLQVRLLGVAFDPQLGLGAGEDSLFTMQLVRAGGRLVWCDESVATDHVPADRMTRRWVLDRARSHGNTETVVELLLADSHHVAVRLRSACRGGVRIVGGYARFGVGVVTGSLRHQARGLRTAYRGLGITLGAIGVIVQEYARPAPADERVSHGRG